MAVTLTTPNTLLGVFQPKGDAARLASNLATVVLGTLLITICAKINVPVWPVPVTLQGFAIAALSACRSSPPAAALPISSARPAASCSASS